MACWVVVIIVIIVTIVIIVIGYHDLVMLGVLVHIQSSYQPLDQNRQMCWKGEEKYCNCPSRVHLDLWLNRSSMRVKCTSGTKSETYVFDEEAFPGIVLFCICLAIRAGSGGWRHGQDHGCTDLYLDVEEVVPDVLEIHVLERDTKRDGIKNVSLYIIITMT